MFLGKAYLKKIYMIHPGIVLTLLKHYVLLVTTVVTSPIKTPTNYMFIHY